LLTAVGAALRFHFLDRKIFWFDECFSSEVARLDWHSFARLLWAREANMSLYYLLLRGWQHFGQSEFFIRSLSAVAAVATLPAIYWLGSQLFDQRVGVLATALLSVNAYHVRYAQEARSYSLFVLLATLSSGFLVAYLREPSQRKKVAYVLASVLAVYAHFYALLLIAAHWLALRLLPGDSARRDAQRVDFRQAVLRDTRRGWLWIGILILPVLVFVAKTGAGPIRWIQRPGVASVAGYYEHMTGHGGPLLVLLYVVAGIVAIGPCFKGLVVRSTARNWVIWRLQFLLIWLLFPVICTLLLSIGRPVFLERYLMFCLPAFTILAAAGLARLQKSWRIGLALSAMLLLSLQGTASYYQHDFDLDREAADAATYYVLNHAQPGDAILFHIAEARVPYEFYKGLRSQRHDEALAQQKPVESPQIIYPVHGNHLDYRDFSGKPTAEFLRLEPPRHPRVWLMLMENGPASNPDATTLMVRHALEESFGHAQRFEFNRVEVWLYSRR
jgi:mannosyltransferase